MSLIPDEYLQTGKKFPLAPMVDFLFLFLAVFACLAITRVSLHDAKIQLAKIAPKEGSSLGDDLVCAVNVSIDAEGKLRWIGDLGEYEMRSPEELTAHLLEQHRLGSLPEEKEQTRIFLHIDKNAKWEPILDLIFAVRETGFSVHPVYESLNDHF